MPKRGFFFDLTDEMENNANVHRESSSQVERKTGRNLVARGKSVDPGLMVHDVHRRHAHAGGDRHFLDHVAVAPLERIRNNFV